MSYQPDAIAAAFDGQFDTRIDFLLAYGSVVHGYPRGSSDLDLFLMLKDRDYKDIEKSREAVVRLGGFVVDLSMQYTEELPENPKNFRDGTKGCLALTYLSAADTILGENVFPTMLESIEARDMRKSICDTVRVYSDRVVMKSVAHGESAWMRDFTIKYFSRTLVDALMFFEPSDMEPYNKLIEDEILAIAAEHPILGEYLQGVDLQETSVFDIAAATSQISQVLRNYFNAMYDQEVGSVSEDAKAKWL